MRPPPKIVRRIVIQPAVVLGVGAAALSLPVVVPLAAFLSRYVPGKWRILRIVWFLFLYALVEALVLTASFGLWLVSGFGARMSEPRFVAANYWLLGWALRRLVASAKFTFGVSILREGERPRTVGRRPALVLSRHAGPGDSLLLMDRLYNTYGRRPRIVLKSFLQWDPAIDVLLNRLPSAFVVEGRGSDVVDAIADMAAGLGSEDALVIFPEGGNFSPTRHRRAIAMLREIGRPELAERASRLKSMLPPKPKGVMAAIGAAPGADVFFVGHAGLEAFDTIGEIWRGMPIGTDIAVKIWHVPAENVPPPERQEEWLYDTWAVIDRWIGERLSATAEPFDDPDAY